MTNEFELKTEFVEFIPKTLKQNVLYISIPYHTAIHKCPCGCGNEVVTPFSLTDWKLIFEGSHISINPSIGNWSFECKSHYWIIKNKVVWAENWSNEEISKTRIADRINKRIYFQTKNIKTKSSNIKISLISRILKALTKITK